MKFLLSGTTTLEGRERRNGEKLRLLLLDLPSGRCSVGTSWISFVPSGTTTLEGRDRLNGEKLVLLRLEEVDDSFCMVGRCDDFSNSKGIWDGNEARGGEGLTAYR